MSVKGGQIIHTADGYLISRVQTGGAASINQATEKIYELGNFNAVSTIRDIPDLTFDLESFDMTCIVEAILTGANPNSIVTGQEFDFADAMPIDVISPYKSNTGAYNIVKGIAVPYLNLERATYRFGVRQNSTQAFSLRGDSIVYIPGQPYYQEYTNVGAGTYTFTNTAIEYVESGTSLYALCVTAIDRDTKVSTRLFIGDDYTNTSTGFTLTAAGASHAPSGTYDKLVVVYGSATITNSYTQAIHPNTTLVPGAVRGKDIDVYVGTTAATPVFSRWTSVQSVEVTRSVNLEADEELGNPHYVTQDYVTADVTGTINVKPRDVTELFNRIAEIAGVATNKIAGPFTTAELPVEIRISHPDTGAVVKTLYIPDAQFTMPGVQGRANTKLETALAFSSESGQLLVYSGAR